MYNTTGWATKEKKAFPKGPLGGCLLGLETTAAAYVEEPGYRDV